MREHMPDTHGEVDRGPRIDWPRIPADSPEVQAVIKQGRDRPRLLTLEDRRLARKNKQDSREAAAQFEQWAESVGSEPYTAQRTQSFTEFIPEGISRAVDMQGGAG